MRNIFDQYSQPENRLTHALMTALHLDRDLLQSFFRKVIGVKLPCATSKLKLLTQSSPGLSEQSEENEEQRGIPDGWIYSEEEEWCIIIEIKVTAAFDSQQIKRHIKTAEKKFKTVIAVAILPITPSSRVDGITILQWSNVYEWLVDQSNGRDNWASHAARFIEVLEGQRIQEGKLVDGNLTTFVGFPFSKEDTYSSREARRLMGLAVRELRDHTLLKGLLSNDEKNSQIRNTEDGAWTTLNLKEFVAERDFTKVPHLTLSISKACVDAMLTLPNNMQGPLRKNLRNLGEGGFQNRIGDVVNGMERMFQLSPNAVAFFRGQQRRYRGRRDKNPQMDALLEGDLRTALESKSGPKHQPVWLDAAYKAFVDKSDYNFEIQFGARFSFLTCGEELNSKKAIELIAHAWCSCIPIVKLPEK
jgi:hypothetical protein